VRLFEDAKGLQMISAATSPRSRRASSDRADHQPVQRRLCPAPSGLIAAWQWGCSRQLPPDDTLVIGQVAEPRSLDPHVTTALNDFRILVNLYEGLVRYRPGTLEPMPGLAEPGPLRRRAGV
jgi:ABC-type transport system substrate-binding protein